MNNNSRVRQPAAGERCSPRVYSLREITVSYEGRDEQITIKPPNLSARGMFINTSRSFPEGAVLNLRFELLLTNAEVQTRCEVRYCQPGVGIGVEFIRLSPEEIALIEREIALSGKQAAQPAARKTKPLRTAARSRAPRRH